MAGKVWFVTGVSTGFGRVFMEELPKIGDIVVGTVRNAELISEIEAIAPGKSFAKLADVTDRGQIRLAVDWTIKKFGKIDILVNNAGYGQMGAVEELSDKELRDQFETNFFGAVSVTQEVLPIMRAQRSGNIVQISSIAGFRAAPGLGCYNSSKFALEGISEALAQEVAPLGIKVTIVEPGPFRTDFSGRSLRKAGQSIPDYDSAAHPRIEQVVSMNGRQEGDPIKAIRVIVEAVESPNPPLRLPLGMITITRMKEKLAQVAADIEQWEARGAETAFS